MKDKTRKSLTLVVLLSALLLPLIVTGQQPTKFFSQHDPTNHPFCTTASSTDCVRGAKVLRKTGAVIDFANPVVTIPFSAFQQLPSSPIWEAEVAIPGTITGQRYGTIEFVNVIVGVDPNGAEVLSVQGADIAQIEKRPNPPVGFGVR